jgi:hypothetical protein
MWPTFLHDFTLSWDFELLETCQMNGCIFRIGGVMSPGPILRIDIVFSVVNHIINEDIFVFAGEENVYCIIFLPRDEIVVVLGGKLVEFKGCPDRVLNHDDRFFMKKS